MSAQNISSNNSSDEKQMNFITNDGSGQNPINQQLKDHEDTYYYQNQLPNNNSHNKDQQITAHSYNNEPHKSLTKRTESQPANTNNKIQLSPQYENYQNQSAYKITERHNEESSANFKKKTDPNYNLLKEAAMDRYILPQHLKFDTSLHYSMNHNEYGILSESAEKKHVKKDNSLQEIRHNYVDNKPIYIKKVITPSRHVVTRSLDYDNLRHQNSYPMMKGDYQKINTDIDEQDRKIFELKLAQTSSKNDKLPPYPHQEGITFRNDKIRSFVTGHIDSKENLHTNPLNMSNENSNFCEEFYDPKTNDKHSIFSKNGLLMDHSIDPKSEIDASSISNNNCLLNFVRQNTEFSSHSKRDNSSFPDVNSFDTQLGSNSDFYNSVLKQPDLLKDFFDKSCSEIYKKSILNDLSDVQMKLFDFVNSIVSDLNHKMESNNNRILQAENFNKGVTDNLVDLQQGMNDIKDKISKQLYQESLLEKRLIKVEEFLENENIKKIKKIDLKKIDEVYNYYEALKNGEVLKNLKVEINANINEEISVQREKINELIDIKIDQSVSEKFQKEKEFLMNNSKNKEKTVNFNDSTIEAINLDIFNLKKCFGQLKISADSKSNTQDFEEKFAELSKNLEERISSKNQTTEETLQNQQNLNSLYEKVPQIENFIKESKEKNQSVEEILKDLEGSYVQLHAEFFNQKDRDNIILNNLTTIKGNFDIQVNNLQQKVDIFGYDIGQIKKDVIESKINLEKLTERARGSHEGFPGENFLNTKRNLSNLQLKIEPGRNSLPVGFLEGKTSSKYIDTSFDELSKSSNRNDIMISKVPTCMSHVDFSTNNEEEILGCSLISSDKQDTMRLDSVRLNQPSMSVPNSKIIQENNSTINNHNNHSSKFSHNHVSELSEDQVLMRNLLMKSNPGEFCEPHFEGNISNIYNSNHFENDVSDLFEKKELENFMNNEDDLFIRPIELHGSDDKNYYSAMKKQKNEDLKLGDKISNSNEKLTINNFNVISGKKSHSDSVDDVHLSNRCFSVTKSVQNRDEEHSQILGSSIKLSRKFMKESLQQSEKSMQTLNTVEKENNYQALVNNTLDSEDTIVEYMMDEEGFLLDNKNNYILDDQGNPIKLDQKDIDTAKQNGLYEEVESSFL